MKFIRGDITKIDIFREIKEGTDNLAKIADKLGISISVVRRNAENMKLDSHLKKKVVYGPKDDVWNITEQGKEWYNKKKDEDRVICEL